MSCRPSQSVFSVGSTTMSVGRAGISEMTSDHHATRGYAQFWPGRLYPDWARWAMGATTTSGLVRTEVYDERWC
jgi:hypothetical protein